MIGTFFSDVGAELLGRLGRVDQRPEEVVGRLAAMAEWSDRDFVRTTSGLVIERPSHMRGLHNDFPYLFSLGCRTNPLDPPASPVVNG